MALRAAVWIEAMSRATAAFAPLAVGRRPLRTAAQGRLDPFAAPFGYDRYLRSPAEDWSPRQALVAALIDSQLAQELPLAMVGEKAHLGQVRRRLQAAKVGAIVGESRLVARSWVSIRGLSDVKVTLTPIEFARRASRLYAKREAVIDGDLRYTYEEFLTRCDRWSASLQKMGIKRGDRVAYIAPNTHAQLESFYAVPQIGAVLVPINYRLIAEDFAHIVNHSGARVL